MAKKVVVTGGAGFVGSNLSQFLIRNNYHVTILDDLSREKSDMNLAWLREFGLGKFEFVHSSVLDMAALRQVTRGADLVFHLAGQVAVTTSVQDPLRDFEVNARGALNVLEACRMARTNPIIFFTSTNKVYGSLDHLALLQREKRYEYTSHMEGVDEKASLHFQTPYGCSKGTADQYALDYHRTYGMRTIVFRMSCIYGPRQFGTEDQGWVAHFVISAGMGRPLTIYGDGKQVRDILFIDDLIRAFQLASTHIEQTQGNVYNIGGGVEKTISLLELAEQLEKLHRNPLSVSFMGWRPGDQKIYISDIRKAESDFGWRPLVGTTEGIQRLWEWVLTNKHLL